MASSATITTSSSVYGTIINSSPNSTITISTYSDVSGILQNSTPSLSVTITTASIVSSPVLADLGNPYGASTITTFSTVAGAILNFWFYVIF